MMKNSSWRGKDALVIALSVMCLAVLSCFLLLGPRHYHEDLKCHNDCPACHWQAAGFFLVHEEFVLPFVAGIALLALLPVRAPVRTRIIRPLSIRGPPHCIG